MIALRAVRLFSWLALGLLPAAGCGPTEVLVGEAPGLARVVAGIPGVTHQFSILDEAATGDAQTIPLGSPAGLAAFEDGSFYFADRFRRRIGFVTAEGLLSYPVGKGLCPMPGLSGDAPSDVCLTDPTGIAHEPGGALVIADAGAHVVYRVVPEGDRIERVFGTGVAGAALDGATAVSAPSAGPADVAFGPDGMLYVAERRNNRVVRVDSDGHVEAVVGAGTVGDAGDGGPSAAALLRGPQGLAWMGDTLYISDTGNNRIRRVINDTIYAYAGIGTAGFAGDGRPANVALFARPGRMTVAGSLLFVADRDNFRVRVIRVGPDSIATFGGTGVAATSTNELEVGRTPLAGPAGLAAAGRAVFIADSGAFVVRRVFR